MRPSPVSLRRPLLLVARFVILVALFGVVAAPHPTPTLAGSTATLVKDISATVPSSMGSLLDQAVTIGTTTFFTASRQNYLGESHTDLYKTDGTTTTTVLVGDVELLLLTAYGQHVVFATDSDVSGDSTVLTLWSSDGTPAGTSVFFQFDSTFDRVFSTITLSNKLFLLMHETTGGYSLWRSDGTRTGTVRLHQFAPGAGSEPSTLVALGTALFFRAYDADAGWELWRSDGTEAGTGRVNDIKPGIDSGNPGAFITVGPNLFFPAATSTGAGLWKSDGTAAGTSEVKSLTPNTGFLGSVLANVGGTIFFATRESDGVGNVVRQLWKSDGTPAGTIVVKTLPPVDYNNQGQLTQFVAVGNRLVFIFDNLSAGFDLWTSDGSDAGTVLSKTFSPSTSVSATPRPFVVVNSNLFFTANDGTHGDVLWKSDGSASGTTVVTQTIPETSLYNANETLLFGTKTYPEGLTLWRSDGSETGTLAVKTLSPLTDDAFSRNQPAFVIIGSTLFFQANDDVHGSDLWRSDGTEAGTQLVRDTANYRGIYDLMAVGNRLFFTADDGVHGYELWTSDGTETGTRMVKDINGYPDGSANSSSSGATSLVDFNGTLYFTADDGLTGRELWKSDGTEAGTIRITELNPGTRDGVYGLAVAGNTLLLNADDGVRGIELWVSDGTNAGTMLLKDIAPGDASSQFSGRLKLVRLGDQFFLWVPIGPTTGLWKTDTTAAGTVFVKAESPNLDTAMVSNNLLFYLSGDAATGSELWASDGTTAGTRMVKDINPGGASSLPAQLSDLNGVLLFTANDGTNSSALWRSDGTAPGTQPIAKSATNQPLVGVSKLTALPKQGVAVFAMYTLSSGIELWQTDGTAPNTRPTVEIAPGPASANPHSFVINGDTLYFAADDWTYGMELWRMPVSVLSAPSTTYNVYLPVLAGK